uniref:(northern house mosquito) hypothetical protein n=1 Tax=Culex pipiens TaxID=7175 RepID=A0A8D8A8Q4_CULPI
MSFRDFLLMFVLCCFCFPCAFVCLLAFSFLVCFVSYQLKRRLLINFFFVLCVCDCVCVYASIVCFSVFTVSNVSYQMFCTLANVRKYIYLCLMYIVSSVVVFVDVYISLPLTSR